MSVLKLYHGSDHEIKKPLLSFGKQTNDYGQGFYCTEQKEMAKEWACKTGNDGVVNAYSFNTENLRCLDLTDTQYTILNWIAILLKYRTFSLEGDIAVRIKNYVLERFYIDVSQYDFVKGYRADDSYFSFASAFVQNSLSLKQLNQALYLGKLGIQIVLVSNQAFQQISFDQSQMVDAKTYHTKFQKRDKNARDDFQKKVKQIDNLENEIYAMDILRKGMTNESIRQALSE